MASLTGGERGFDLPARVSAWRAREAALREGASELAEPKPQVAPAPLAPEEHKAWNWSLPWATLRREVIGALLLQFGAPRLAELGVDLERSAWGTSRSWPEARRRLRLARNVAWPSELLSQLADPARCEALLADCVDPLAFGVRLGRYDERLTELGHLAPAGPALDVGSATGEGAWELAAALGVPVVGTDACPLLVELAQAQRVPHAPARERALQRFMRQHRLAADAVRFVVADVSEPAPAPGSFAVIACHGVLGESVRRQHAIDRALDQLAAALLPGGVLSLAHRFRQDRRAAMDLAIERAVQRHSLEVLGPDLLRKPV